MKMSKSLAGELACVVPSTPGWVAPTAPRPTEELPSIKPAQADDILSEQMRWVMERIRTQPGITTTALTHASNRRFGRAGWTMRHMLETLEAKKKIHNIAEGDGFSAKARWFIGQQKEDEHA